MKDRNISLAQELDTQKAQHIISRVDKNSELVDELVDNLVQEYCSQLDEYMKQIDDVLTQQEFPVTNVQLDDFTLNLPVILYFVSSAQESLGIKEDVSNAIRAEIYNKVREKASGTVADKDTAAELATQAEAIVSIAYKRAYRKVKARVEAAYEMLNSVKKVISRRIYEAELDIMDKGRMK